MSVANLYATVEEFLQSYDIPDGMTNIVEKKLERASRYIDDYCHHEFYTSAVHTVRYFTAEYPDICLIDALSTLDASGLQTDNDADGTYETTWATTDYTTLPVNATPITRIDVTPWGVNSFPTHRNGVKITGTWGYTLPAPISEACLIYAYRLWMRRGTPFETDQGLHIQDDPDLVRLLAPYVAGDWY